MCSQSEGSGWASIACVTGTKPSVCASIGIAARAAIVRAAATSEEVLIIASKADLKVRLYVRVSEGPPIRPATTNDQRSTTNGQRPTLLEPIREHRHTQRVEMRAVVVEDPLVVRIDEKAAA